jgi:predicted ATPase
MHSIDGAPELRSDNGKNSYPEVDFFRTALAEFANVNYPTIRKIFQFVTQRWQMLDGNFMPPLKAEAVATLETIDRYATNLLFILNHMGLVYPALFNNLQEDLKWILGYVDKLEMEHKDFDLRMVIKEISHTDQEAPTISAGTKRLVAMLTAFYALDMRSPEMPGLVVIEEPDTALNPGILRNFVEQLRYFTTGEHPRQVIMTTHNPRFLDYFEPEEVRVVTRDEHGYTIVEPIPEHIKDIWLDKYTLGEVWMTNSLGGLSD